MSAPSGIGLAAGQAQALRRYYGASTGRFLRFGGSGASLAIHRGLWPKGVTSAEAAAAEINERVVARLDRHGITSPDLLRDLGCGVGGSLFRFAAAWPQTQLEGLTLSARQADMARRFTRERGLGDRVTIRCADFLKPPEGPSADVAVAIESHLHAPSAAAFFAAARAGLRQGGHLVIVDDMLAKPEADLTPAEARCLETFRRGWHLGHVPDLAALNGAAAAQGFAIRHDEDLTPLLRLDRLRDRALRVAGPLADAAGLGRWPLFSNMIGGNALTVGYLRGLMRYRLILLEAL